MVRVTLLYTLTVYGAATGAGRPVVDADVYLTSNVDGRTIGPRAARYFSSRYQVLVPDEGAESVDVEVLVVNNGDATSFRHELPGSGARPWRGLVPSSSGQQVPPASLSDPSGTFEGPTAQLRRGSTASELTGSP